ncbi:monofunctional biosynthetic peptidoglycan transglycosylase [Paracoccus aerodenitrificans]|uniref:monofunctional biosynthetic peptidoglycan transglycosylase n=1 Tax=Paracoccus aerodenitrificans TaxID=3017781 RepID=UPI0022F07562|nr:monofunctional biosynthetic peptidoglycan transglycosylase [Paracoccus aerodenitrificans]WBU63879.1 monofunctional biosynthetic peptidoglycan transglycosylase [Paracoccus aerodenitrificans]
MMDDAVPVPPRRRFSLMGWVWSWIVWITIRLLLLAFLLVLLFSVFNPPTTLTIIQASREYPIFDRRWTALEDIPPVVRRSIVAAEDANFCSHWGFDMQEIRRVIASGGNGGASTLSQQVVKNVYLWQDRSWTRKAIEAVMTPMIEMVWSKRRILEVYLNVAEFGPGVFGIRAASAYHFGTTPDRLDAVQAARLAALLPSPKTRDARSPSPRSRSIADGAATIVRDGRDVCIR